MTTTTTTTKKIKIKKKSNHSRRVYITLTHFVTHKQCVSVDVCQEKNTHKSYIILVCTGGYFQIKGGGRMAGMQIALGSLAETVAGKNIKNNTTNSLGIDGGYV